VPGASARADGGDVHLDTDTRQAERVAPDSAESIRPDRPWLVIVWNDPVNLMTYVTYVFQKLFGFSLDKATRLMLDVHEEGRAVVTSGARERAELDVARLHRYGLWATMEQAQ
jgi:ATP-dependent Clp protease adaptor protein ClpS